MSKGYKRILVPLDGSKAAEKALPDTIALAGMSGAEITLFRVLPFMRDVIETGDGPIYVDEQWDIRKAQAERYLKAIAERPECKQIKMSTVVETGPVAETIMEYALKNNIDIIVMATHGRTGFKRWSFGSVAEKVVRGADRPVLLVRAHSDAGGK